MAIPRLNPSGDRPTFENRVDSQGRPISSNVPVTKAELAQFWNAEERIRNGNKENSSNKQTRVTTTSNRMSMALTNKLNTMIRQLDGINQNTERMMNILAYQNKAKKKSLDDEEKEDIEKNKKDSEIHQKQRSGFGAFSSFFRALAGWGKIVETLLLPVIMGIISALVKAKKYLGAIGVAVGSLLMSKGIRRALGHGLSALGKAIRNKFSGNSKTTKEEVEKESEPKGKANKAEEAEKNIGKEAEKYTEHTNKNGQKVFRDSKGKFVKKEIAEAAKEAEKAGTFMGKFSKAFGVVSKIFKVVGRFFVLVDVINTVIGTIHGAITGYQKGGVLGALEGGARGFLNSFIGWIWDLGTWAIGSLFKLFGADKIGDSIKKFNFDKLLDKMVDWVGEGIEAIGKGVHAAVQAMKNSIASLLDHLPGPVKKLIPASIWSALGRRNDGSRPEDDAAQRREALAAGGISAVTRHEVATSNGGKDLESNMTAEQRKQFEAQIAQLRVGKKIDVSKMAALLQAANPSASRGDINHYLDTVVFPQVKTQAAIGKEALDDATVGAIGSKDRFSSIMDSVLKTEGGYVANDNGKGPANFGIDASSNQDLLKKFGITDVKNMTRDQAIAIYKMKYWNRAGITGAPNWAQGQLFDASVNMGPGSAQKLMERIKKGEIKNPQQLAAARKAMYQNIIKAHPHDKRYEASWNARTDKMASQDMAATSVPQMPPTNSIASTSGKGGNNTLVNAPVYNTNKSAGGPNQLGITAVSPSATAHAVS